MNKGTLRVLNALTLFTRQPVWGVTELSRELECSKNSAFQALDTLIREGYLVRDQSGKKYQLSHLVLTLSKGNEPADVRTLCMPYMHQLHKLTGESLFLSILVGRHHVCIESIQAQGVTVGYSPITQPLPLHAGAGSRLMLACLKDEEIEQYLKLESPLKKFTPTTITEPKEIWKEVELIRKMGFARGYEDFSTGATYLSFPVFGAMNRPLAAITIGGPIFRFTREKADHFIPELRRILQELNHQSRMFAAAPEIKFF